MKKLFLILACGLCLTSCRSCMADFAERKAGVRKVCPTCVFQSNRNNSGYIAVDTAQRPNIVYEVYFCTGGFGYSASDVDHLTRIY